MISSSLERLSHLCNVIPGKLEQIPEAEFIFKPRPEKWSRKEIIGHLIDSAANNHQRFVRAQFEECPHIVYDQNNWNAASNYNNLDSRQLIAFWTSYNRHLFAVVRTIPEHLLLRKCTTGKESHTIAWLFKDYVAHMEHHLRQFLDYE